VRKRLSEKSLEILQHLSLRGSAWPEASSAAIRDLRARMACQTNQTANETTSSGDTNDNVVTSMSHTAIPASSIQNNSLPTDKTSGESREDQDGVTNSGFEPLGEAAGVGPTFGVDSSYWITNFETEVSENMTFLNPNSLDPFSGYDIPFWFDQEEYWNFT
jgi:hypothetical protein